MAVSSQLIDSPNFSLTIIIIYFFFIINLPFIYVRDSSSFFSREAEGCGIAHRNQPQEIMENGGEQNL